MADDPPVQDMQIGTRLDQDLAQEMVNMGFEMNIPTASSCIREAVRYWVRHKTKILNAYHKNKFEKRHGIS